MLITRDQEGEDMKASDAIRLLREGNIEDKLNKYSISDVVLRGIFVDNIVNRLPL